MLEKLVHGPREKKQPGSKELKPSSVSKEDKSGSGGYANFASGLLKFSELKERIVEFENMYLHLIFICMCTN